MRIDLIESYPAGDDLALFKRDRTNVADSPSFEGLDDSVADLLRELIHRYAMAFGFGSDGDGGGQPLGNE